MMNYDALLRNYLQLPNRLETVIVGLSEADLDLTKGEGWSIRQYVHHVVEGEAMWQMFLRVIVGRSGAEIPIQWYFAIPQEEWARRWVYDKRPIEPALALFRANTRNLGEFLRLVPAQIWKHCGYVTWPGAKEESRLAVRAIILMQIRHVNSHVADIRAILQGREEYRVWQK